MKTIEKERMLLCEETKEQIRRQQEKIFLQGRSPFTFLEQFAADIMIQIYSETQESSLGVILRRAEREVWEKIADGFEQVRKDMPKDHFMHFMELEEEGTLFWEIWQIAEYFTERYGKEWPVFMEMAREAVGYILFCIGRSQKTLFFTPDPVAEMMAGIAETELMEKEEINSGVRMWDPACGTGSLVEKACGLEDVVEVRGSDTEESMLQAARIRMAFSDRGFTRLILKRENSLSMENMRNIWPDGGRNGEDSRKYGLILSNPPVSSVYSSEYFPGDFPVETKKLHLQFLQLIMRALEENGTAVVLINESFLFNELAPEKKIRQMLVREYALEAVVSLPEGAFAPYTMTKSSMLIFHGKAGSSPSVLFCELDQIGYTLNRERRPAAENDIPHFLEMWKKRKELCSRWQDAIRYSSERNEYQIAVPSEWNEPKYWFASGKDIIEQDYSLDGKRYRMETRKAKDTEDPHRLMKELEELEWDSQRRLEELMESLREYDDFEV